MIVYITIILIIYYCHCSICESSTFVKLRLESCLTTACWRQRAFSCGISHPPRWAEVEEGQVGHQSFPLPASFPCSTFAMSTWKRAFSEAPHVFTWLSLVDSLKFRCRPAFLHATHVFFGNIEKTMRNSLGKVKYSQSHQELEIIRSTTTSSSLEALPMQDGNGSRA